MKKMRRYGRFADHDTYKMLFSALTNQKKTHCPHCSSQRIVLFGKYRDRQRYKCKDCSKTFNDLTNTPLHWIHLPISFIKFLECMVFGYSLYRAAAIIGISPITAFYWRHKMIKALEQVEQKQGVPQIDLDKMKYQWTCPFITFRTTIPINLQTIYPHKPQEFQKWMSYYHWISFKYLNRYIAWFRFLQTVDKQGMLDSMLELLLTTSSVPMERNYSFLRLAS